MARQIIERVVSDLSGQPIPEGKAWTMTLTPPDGRRNPVRLDLSEAEVQQFLSKGTEVKRRGRRPGVKIKAAANGRRKSRSVKTKTAANGRRKSRSVKTKTRANGRRKRRSASTR